MKIKKFEDIIAWQKAQDYSVEIYAHFNNLKDYGFKDQICEAFVSISDNIVEGFDMGSNAEFKRFLFISLDSCSETKPILYLSARLVYLNESTKNGLLSASNKVFKITRGLIKSIENSYTFY